MARPPPKRPPASIEPGPLTAREQTVFDLVRRYGREEARRIIADYHHAFPKDNAALIDLEIYASMHRPAEFGEAGQRTEGRREMIFHIRAVLALEPDDVAAVPLQPGELEGTEDDDD